MMQNTTLNQVTRAVLELSRQLKATAFAVGAGLCFAAPGYAQEAPKTNTDDGASQQLERVLVTARKKTELIQDVPVSITAVSANDLVAQAAPSVTEFYTKIPGLAVAAGSGGKSELVLRGITTGPNANPTTGFTIDDAPFGASTFSGNGAGMIPDIDPFDLQRVEVLRGPQGTLYGATSLGGLVKYVTVAPDTNKLSGRVQLGGSKTSNGSSGHDARAALNVPLIGDTLGVRVSVFDRKDPGFIDDPRQGKKDVDATKVRGGRISAILNATSDITVRASALTQKQSAEGSPIEDLTATLQPVDGPYTHRRIPGSDIYERKVNFYDLNIEADLKWARLTSVTARGTMDYTGPTDLSAQFSGLLTSVLQTPISGVLLDAPTNNTKVSQEFRLDSPDEGGRLIDWRIGVFYTKEENSSGQVVTPVDKNTGVPLSGLPVVYKGTFSDAYKETAIFGTLTYHVSDQFDVQAGLRRSKNSLTYSTDDVGLPMLVSGSSTHDNSESATTYLLTPRFKVSKNLMVYGTLSSGYRPGGVNPTFAAGGPPTYKSDKTQNLELGLKGQLDGGAFAYNLSVYHIKWKDIQIFGSDPVTHIGYFTNTGGAKSEGIEAEASWIAAKGLTFTGNIVRANAVLTADLPAGLYGVAGDRLPSSPKLTASLSANQEFSLETGLRVNVGASAAYIGDRMERFSEDASDPRLTFPGFTRLDLNAGVKAKTWGVNAYLKNATNRRGILGLANPGPASPYSASILKPRTFGVSAYTTF